MSRFRTRTSKAVAVGTRDRRSSRGRWSRRNSSRRSLWRKPLRIGSAATRQEVKILPVGRAVTSGGSGAAGGSLGWWGVRPTGQSLDTPVGTRIGRTARRDLRRHGCRDHRGVKGQNSYRKVMSIRLDVSRVRRDIRPGHRPQVVVRQGRPTTWTLPRRGTGRRMPHGSGARRARGGPRPDVSSYPGGEDST